MARTRQTKRPRTSTSTSPSTLDIEVSIISSDSSEEILIENQGTQNVSNEVVVEAVEVVEARPVTYRDLGLSTSSDKKQDPEPTPASPTPVPATKEPTSTVRSSESHQFTIKQGVLEGEAIVQLLEQDLLNSLAGALKHKSNPFSSLRIAWKETDFEYCENLDQDLDYRIHRLRHLVEIPRKYEHSSSVKLWRSLAGTEKE